ncbi:UbiD family decarboxylase [Halopiger aswanensis]|uniref:4-hydroxy-3-polyprenylbenzoate decarboxylase n=1 Tax=Halopiger aswanensis TaxID=148449 RepID=A0A419W1F2_9EURY|nr:UbiD family decarboxylase [Halopiger aswanensis]RKD89311.1 4-hydroxy-3-polyprenylbenzoate decarboxylase [Halopiger aswanensis]
MFADSFRTYLHFLEDENDCIRISEPTSWDLEASAVTTLANRTDGEVPIFESIKEDTIGAALVGDPYRGPQYRPWDHLARSFGLPAGLSGTAYYERVVERLRSPREPRVVDRGTAPCKEVVHTGTDVDLLSIPWPYIHQGDGGRYSNLHTVVAPDPETRWGHWSSHRMMIHDDALASLLFLAGEQAPNRYYYEYEPGDEPMPVAVVLGAEPAVQCSTEMWIPTGRSEAAFAGGLKDSPVNLVPCETSDLFVPATAELVVEGRVLPNERLDEGPFGDYFGYMNGPRRSMPVLAVDAITHRSEPRVPFCVEGTGVGYGQNSSSTLQTAAAGPDATLGLRAAGFDVELAVPWRFTSRTVWIIATDRPYPGYLHELANFIFTTWGMLHIDFFVFVDPDVDPLDPRAVLTAIALEADPDADFHQFGVERMPKVPLNIYQTPDEKGSADVGTSKAKTAKAYIDATADRPAADGSEDERLRTRAQELLVDAGLSPEPFDLLGEGGGESG